MKTTIKILGLLLKQVRSIAVQENTTVSALVEEGLRRIKTERQRAKPFQLRKVSFRGEGLQPGIADASWQQIRDAAYEGHGV